MRTQVAIVGAGPGRADAGPPARAGRDRVGGAREPQPRLRRAAASAPACSSRAPSSCCEPPGRASGMDREGIVHHGIELQFDGERHRIPLSELTGGRSIVIYGQTEVVKDLIARPARSRGCRSCSRSTRSRVEGIDSERRASATRHGGGASELDCDLVAGCDGFHGVCRPAIPTGGLRVFERDYPFAWLGILAAVAPSSDELVYAHHPARLRAAEPALALAQPPLPPVPARREDSPTGPTSGSGPSCRSGWASTAGRSPRGPVLEKGDHRACAASSSSRCSTAGSSWRATPPTSSPRPAPRGSTSRSPTSPSSPRR